MRILIIVLVCLPVMGLFGQDRIIKGVIVNDQEQPIHGAHIYNYSNSILTVSDVNGAFSILSSSGDTISITHVGLERIDFIVTDQQFTEQSLFSLAYSTIVLEEVTVGLPSYEGFKELILETNPPDTSFEIFGLKDIDFNKVAFTDKPPIPSANERFRIPTPSGFRARFDMGGLTRRNKELKKLNKIKQRSAEAARKFSREWVASETNLEGDSLTYFIQFCNFSDRYIEETPLYLIREELLKLLSEFRESDKSDPDNRYTPGA